MAVSVSLYRLTNEDRIHIISQLGWRRENLCRRLGSNTKNSNKECKWISLIKNIFDS